MAGEYVCNEKILKVLAERDIDFPLPKVPTFIDHSKKYELDEATFQPGTQVPSASTPAYFEGFPRSGSRGVGTRNFVIVLATTSETAAFTEAVADGFQGISSRYPNVDGVVAVAHTEGGGTTIPNNLDFVLRTLAGFMVHPNVAAVLAVDYGSESYTNDTLRAFMENGDYPLKDVSHEFFRIEADWAGEIDRAAARINQWLPAANAVERRAESVAHLRIALQCGGSDAFSGVSGNALAGYVAKEIIRHGGGANLAETDELIGAEPYVLSNVRDLDTAKTFLEKIENL